MLETIPIVKFDDSEHRHAAAVKGDVEMASRHDGDGPETNRTSVLNENEPVNSTEVENGAERQHSQGETPQTATESATSLNRENPTDAGNNVCPICTDDFVKGQDMRVLPCSHQFHPNCIDPWLINVSGTCPLW
jgi:hypothetical protein